MKKLIKNGHTNKKSNAGKIIFIFFLFFILIFISVNSLASGSHPPLTTTEVFSIILGGSSHDNDRLKETVIWDLRMPRILMSIIAGISFGIAGSLMQGVLKNPLASPYTFGITSGAGFGASLAFVLCIYKVPVIGMYLVIGFAFFFAFFISLCILYLANYAGATPIGIVTVPVLGIGLTWLFATLCSLILFFGETEWTRGLVFWSLGNLSSVSMNDIFFHININKASIPLPGPVLAILVVCCILLLISLFILKLRDFDTIGIRVKPENTPGVKQIRVFFMVIVSLLVAGTVSFTGPIAFIGLIAPHLAYLSVGRDNRFLLPASALLGALLVVVGDLVGRNILVSMHAIVPVGVITSLIGVPLFIYLLLKTTIRSSEFRNDEN